MTTQKKLYSRNSCHIISVSSLSFCLLLYWLFVSFFLSPTVHLALCFLNPFLFAFPLLTLVSISCVISFSFVFHFLFFFFFCFLFLFLLFILFLFFFFFFFSWEVGESPMHTPCTHISVQFYIDQLVWNIYHSQYFFHLMNFTFIPFYNCFSFFWYLPSFLFLYLL